MRTILVSIVSHAVEVTLFLGAGAILAAGMLGLR
jgi:hypothetical protein